MKLDALLLADASLCLRLRVLRVLFDRPENDPEVSELSKLLGRDPLAAGILQSQLPDGSWKSFQRDLRSNKIWMTSQALMRLSYLGFGHRHRAVRRGAEYLFSVQQKDGSWPGNCVPILS